MDVTYKGKTYQLTADATLTNREFLGSWFDTQEGDPYTTEYSAPAIDDQGNKYEVYWHFDDIRDQEPEDAGSYPWSDGKHIFRVVEQ